MSIVKRRVAVLDAQMLDASISLAALGLLAHVEADGWLDVAELQLRYPEIDLLNLADELITAEVIELGPPPPAAPRVAVADLPRSAAARAPGWVYIIAAGDKFKIGITKDVKARLRGHQTSNPMPLRLVLELQNSDCLAIEMAAHQSLSAKRVSGEWFSCTEQEAIEAVNAAVRAYGL